MIIDVNTYVGHWPFRSVKNDTLKQRMDRMDEKGIDISCVSSLNAIFYRDAQRGNGELFQQMGSQAEFKRRFIPFCIINPMYPGWKKDFETCINDYSMGGLELYPAYHKYDLSCPEASELLSLAQEKKIPVLFPCSIENVRQRHWMDVKEDLNPSDILKVAGTFKELDMIISNGPTNVFAHVLKETAKQRTGRIYYDFTRVEILNGVLNRFIGTAGADRVVLGTVSPLQYEEAQYAKLYGARIEAGDRERILGGNLKELFNLQTD